MLLLRWSEAHRRFRHCSELEDAGGAAVGLDRRRAPPPVDRGRALPAFDRTRRRRGFKGQRLRVVAARAVLAEESPRNLTGDCALLRYRQGMLSAFAEGHAKLVTNILLIAFSELKHFARLMITDLNYYFKNKNTPKINRLIFIFTV